MLTALCCCSWARCAARPHRRQPGEHALCVKLTSGTIEKYDLSTRADLGTFASGLSSPTGLAFDNSGDLYVAEAGNGTIEKYTPGGVGSTFATTGGIAGGLAFDNAGNLYLADTYLGRIVEFTPGGVGSAFGSYDYNKPQFLAVQEAPEPSVLSLLGLGLTGVLALRLRTA